MDRDTAQSWSEPPQRALPATGQMTPVRYRGRRAFLGVALALGLTAGLCRADVVLPALAAPAALAEKALKAGDVVRISMQEDAEVHYEGEISAAGTVPLLYLGEVPIAGLAPKAVATKISAALCERNYNRATIQVSLVKAAVVTVAPPDPGKVHVYGAVGKPGLVALPTSGRLTLLRLISEVNGLSAWADPKAAFVLRQVPGNGPLERIPLDLSQLFAVETIASGASFLLQPEDILCVPGLNRGDAELVTVDQSEVIVVGEVKSPGIVRFASGERRTLLRAIFKAGGFTEYAKAKVVRLIRQAPDGTRSEHSVNVADILSEGLLQNDIKIEPGDMLIVPQKIVSF